MISAQRSAELHIGEMGKSLPCSSYPGEIPTPATIETYLDRLPPRPLQFIRFCLVGVSGTVVDMTILGLLADPKGLGLDVTFSKIGAAEVALINNFVWNELWTFKYAQRASGNWAGVLGRLVIFNAICGVGILLAVLLLHLFHSVLGWNLYLSNLIAIGIVTIWNFGMNARFNWTKAATGSAGGTK